MSLPADTNSETIPPDPPEPAVPSDPGDEGGSSGGSEGSSITVTSGSRTLQSVNQSAHTALYRMTGSFSGNTAGDNCRRRIHSYLDGTVTDTTNNGTTSASSSSWDSSTNGQDDITTLCDYNTYSWRARVADLTTGESINGGTNYFRSAAVTGVVGTPSLYSSAWPTDTECAITCQVYPNVHHSTATVWMEYKRTVDSTWTKVGVNAYYTTGVSGYTDYGAVTITRGLSGLTASTQYDVRVQMTRNTVNATSVTGATFQFTTQAGVPVLTTSAASGETSTEATLNGTVDPNDKSTACYFEYGTDATFASVTTVYVNTYTTDGTTTLTKAVTGLTPSTTYYFRSKGVYLGTSYYGSSRSFTTSAPPATPTPVTGAATAITATTVQLNGTVNPNGLTCTAFFQYHAHGDPVEWANETAAQNPGTGTAAVAISAAVTGLTASKVYYFRMVSEYSSTDYVATHSSFTTSAAPAAPETVAAAESFALTIQYDRKYATALATSSHTELTFPLYLPSGSSSNYLYTGTAPAAAEVYIFRDGTYYGTGSAAQPVRYADSTPTGLYYITLTALQTTGTVIDVIVHSASAAYRDVHLQVRTKMQIGQIDADCTALSAGSALKVTGLSGAYAVECNEKTYFANDWEIDGAVKFDSTLAIAGTTTLTGAVTLSSTLATGAVTMASLTSTGALTAGTIVGPVTPGYNAVLGGTAAGGGSSSITLPSTAVGLTGFYTGATIGIHAGTGAGQFRHILSYDGSTKVATVHKAWLTNPNATSQFVMYVGASNWSEAPADELSAVPSTGTPNTPADEPYYEAMIQGLYQYFFFMHTHTRCDAEGDIETDGASFGGVSGSNTNHYMYKSDGTTVLGWYTAIDAGGTITTQIPKTDNDYINAIWRPVA